MVGIRQGEIHDLWVRLCTCLNGILSLVEDMQHDKKINKVYYETNLNYRLRNICDHRGEEDKLCLGKSHLPWV